MKLLRPTHSAVPLEFYISATALFALGGLYATIALPMAGDGFLVVVSLPFAIVMGFEAMGSFHRRRVLLRWRSRRPT